MKGLIPEAVDEAFRKAERAGELHRVKAIYVVSYFDNPSTATLSLARRPQIVELAQRRSRAHTIHVIDDAAYRELRYDGPDLPSLRSFDSDGETVIYTHTFSKSFSPGMRVGWASCPRRWSNRSASRRGTSTSVRRISISMSWPRCSTSGCSSRNSSGCERPIA